MISEKKQNDIVLELLVMIYRKRSRLLVLGVLILLASFLVFKLFVIKHSSTVTFLIDNSEPSEIAVSETEKFAMSQLHELSNNRMYLILFSDEMAERLDENINLGLHYGLNKNEPNYINHILSQMRSNIGIEKGTMNTVKITVNDDNQDYAATFANSLYSNLVEINKKIVRSNLNYKKETYKLDIAHLDTQNKKDMEVFMRELNKLQTTNKSIHENADEMFLLRRDLLNLFTQYNSSSTELKKSALNLQLASATLNDTTLQNLYLVNKAYPQTNTGAYVRASLLSLGIALVCVFYYSLSLLYVQRIKISFRELIRSNGSSQPHIIPASSIKKNYSGEIKTG